MGNKITFILVVLLTALVMLGALFFQKNNQATDSTQNGASQLDETIALCSDSDDGKNIFVKGTTVTRAEEHLINAGEVVHMGIDSCAEKLEDSSNKEERYLEGLGSCSGENCYVAEVFCSGKTDVREFVKCSNGCTDGACLSN